MATAAETNPGGRAPSQQTGARHTREELLAIFEAARAEVRAANPEGRDLEAELIAERRASAVHG
jgi:hypothetical protein